MTKLSAGVTRASEGLDGVIWNILGQTYTLKEESDAAMGWHALLPPGSFVPPHIHPTQDEFIYMIEGKLDLQLGEQKSSAGPGDLIRLPMNEPHGLFNNAAAPVRCLFSVAPLKYVNGDAFPLRALAIPLE